MKKNTCLFLTILLAACGAKSPSDAFVVSDSKLERLTREADSGDLAAVKILIAHYDATSGNEEASERWRAKARLLGDADELYYYSARLSTEAKRSNDRKERRAMLLESLRAARRSYAIRPNESAKKLIDEASQSLVYLEGVE
ncbi:hypothetical protein JWH04_02070 [Xanthomonas melonis]|uniref:hypothetical protein n=1 Tax=Xanthomonas melonis TaxID=56456 RepID=UPI001E2DD4EC|nr:hypothetical protein [Xanthomonas melonis]MCD0277765.1 hypothetical protein [Xanthomonas melonis]